MSPTFALLNATQRTATSFETLEDAQAATSSFDDRDEWCIFRIAQRVGAGELVDTGVGPRA